jgi:hypothetical protein
MGEVSVHAEHPAFIKPENENIKIWRYMDFTKFVSMIDSKILFFSRMDRLGDKFEGSLSRKYYIPPSPEQIAFLEKIFPIIKKIKPDFTKKPDTELNKAIRRWTVVNCWNMSEYDSDLLWKRYLRSGEGIAIQSTYRRLVDSFCNYHENDVYIGVVTYIDYEKEAIPFYENEANPFGNLFFPLVYKKKSFEYEKELRAVIVKFPTAIEFSKSGERNKEFWEADVFPNGLEVPVDLENLVEQVYVSPTSEEWFEELVISVLKKYGFNKQVKKSPLADEPVF